MTTDELPGPGAPRSHDPEGAPLSRPSHAPAYFFGRDRALPLALLVGVFFGAVLTGRLVAPALLGWKAGIERLIERADLVAAMFGQLAVVAGCLMAIQLVIATLVESRLSVFYRLAVAPITAGVITLVMVSTSRELPLLLVMVLALLTGLIALAASLPTVLADQTRALGFVLALGGATALMQITARALAVWASHEALVSLFRSAQMLATAVLVVDLVVLGVTGTWLASRRFVALGIASAILLALSMAISWAALAGAGSSGGWLVLASQAMNELARHPWPLVPRFAHYTLQVLLLLAVPATFVARRDRPFCRTALALALLARGGTDVPVLALALTLAALFGPLAATREAARPLPQRPRA